MQKILYGALYGAEVIGISVFGLWLQDLGLSKSLALLVWVVCLVVALLITNRLTRAQSRAASGKRSLSWIDIEEKFKDLRTRAHKYSWDAQDPHPLCAMQFSLREGQEWEFNGSSVAFRDEAEELCALAGAKLKTDGLATSPRLERVQRDAERWLWFLIEMDRSAVDHRIRTDSYGRGEDYTEQYHYQIKPLLDACVSGAQKCLRSEVVSNG